jgi:hypothetical protein
LQSLADVSLGLSELFLLGGLITPPNPKRHEDDQRSYEGGHDVSQRDRNSVQPWGKPKNSKQQATNEGSEKTHAQISEEAKAFALPSDHQPSEASSKQPDNNPDDELIGRWHHRSPQQVIPLLSWVSAEKQNEYQGQQEREGHERGNIVFR